MLARRAERGQSVSALERRPEVFPGYAPIWEAYQIVSRGRQSGASGPGAISLRDIQAYFDMFGVTSTDKKEQYLQIIYALDGVYLKWFNDRRKGP